MSTSCAEGSIGKAQRGLDVGPWAAAYSLAAHIIGVVAGRLYDSMFAMLIIRVLMSLLVLSVGAVHLGAEESSGSQENEVGEFSIRSVIPLSGPAVLALRQLVAEQPDAAALAAVAIGDAEAALAVEPHPLAIIHYEGLVNTDPKRIADVEHLATLDDVAALVRGWQVSGRADFATAALAHVQAWAVTYQVTGNDVNENKLVPLLVAWHGLQDQPGVVPAMSEESAAQVQEWVEAMGKKHAVAVAESQHFTNRYTKHVRLAVYCGLAAHHDEWIALGQQGIERFVTASLRPNGSSLDLERRDTLTYHCSALVPALELALLLGERSKHAMYEWESPEGGSLKASVDYVIPYATGEKMHKEWVNTKVELDRKRAVAGLEKYRTGRLFDPKDAASVLEAASAFDQTLIPVWAQVTESPAGTYGSWQMLIQAALRAAPEAE